ncbi:MAG: HAD family hydrolase [Candidatus Bathyarchaeota archaeon]|nr:HAD family hydrolase [Candidatus Bathyarchaeota archaeon]
MLQLKHLPTGVPFNIPLRQKAPFDAVLFDLFDTLVLINNEHDAYMQSLRKAHQYLSANGLNCTFSAFKQTCLKVADRIEHETAVSLEEPHFSSYIERTIAELGRKLKDQTFLAIDAANEFSKEFKKHITVDPQALEVLSLIHRSHKVGVISNLSFSECAWELLEEHHLIEFLDLTVVSGDINLRKPHPHIFNMALRYLGVEASDAVFVGDNLETDVLGSKRAGLTSVHIKRRNQTASAIRPHLAINQLSQLLPLLDIDPAQLAAVTGQTGVVCPLYQ